MRVLILTLILLVPLSSNCFAITNGQLYEYCKPFTDRVFEAKTSADMACLAYFRGIADNGEQICGSVKEVIARPDISTTEKAVLNSVILIYGIGFTGSDKLKPAIQLFVNEMAATPEKWESGAASVAHSSIQKVAPCE